MKVCETPLRANEDRGLDELAGFNVQHDLSFSIPDWSAWTVISERIASIGANIHALQLTRRDEGFSVRCRLERASSEAARALVTGLLNDGLADRADVEHVVLAKRYAGAQL